MAVDRPQPLAVPFTPEQVVNWQVYVEAMFLEKQRALDAALAAQKEAVVKAEIATDRIAARAMSDQEALRNEIGERLAALRRELEAATSAQKEAVLKQEQANERRFEGVNEWRAQSADRERSQIEERARLTASFVLKEVSEARWEQMDMRMNDMQSRLDTASGEKHGVGEYRAVVLSVVAVFIALSGVIAAIVSLHP